MPGRSIPVVFDVNIFIGAVTETGGSFASWPSPPPVRGNLAANAVGIVNDAREFALYVSEHILVNVIRVLQDKYRWDADRAAEYVSVIVDIAYASGGGEVSPTNTVTDCKDFEDNRILECAESAGAMLIVSDDTDLLSMSPWRGTPIITAEDFARRTDASRR
ncbi:MAG: PIN domain-containing protein [Acidimicrobiia bacterium]